MRRTLAVLSLSAALLGVSATQSVAKSSLKSCPAVNAKIGTKNYVIAIKVKAKGVPCSAMKQFWTVVATSEGQLPADLQALRNRCKDDKNQAAAGKAGRIAMTCASANGKRVAKAWVQGG